jgi:hypothetical protein
VDENQNNLASLTFGLSDVGRMEILLELADLLKQEKAIQQAMNIHPERKYELQEE